MEIKGYPQLKLNRIFDGMVRPYNLKPSEIKIFTDDSGNVRYLYYVCYRDGELILVDEEGIFYKIQSSSNRTFWWKKIVKDDTKVKEFIDGFVPMFTELGLNVQIVDDPLYDVYRLDIKKNGELILNLSYIEYGNKVYTINLYYHNCNLPDEVIFDLGMHENKLTIDMNLMMMNTFLMILKLKGVIK